MTGRRASRGAPWAGGQVETRYPRKGAPPNDRTMPGGVTARGALDVRGGRHSGAPHFRFKHMFGGGALDLTPGSSSSRHCLKYASDGILSEETAPPPEDVPSSIYTRWPFIKACNEPRPLIRISPVLSKMARNGCNSGPAARGRARGREAGDARPIRTRRNGCPPDPRWLRGNVAWARWQAAACVTRIRRKNVSAWTFGSFGDCCLVWPKPKGLRGRARRRSRLDE